MINYFTTFLNFISKWLTSLFFALDNGKNLVVLRVVELLTKISVYVRFIMGKAKARKAKNLWV